jgi:membrane protease subunit (stomatin/prohibitin family)
MNMLGDMNKYTQFQTAQSIPIAAANEGGGAAGVGVGLGAGMAMAQSMMNALKTPAAPEAAAPVAPAAPVTPSADTKFCVNCGHRIPKAAKFCSECGTPQ